MLLFGLVAFTKQSKQPAADSHTLGMMSALTGCVFSLPSGTLAHPHKAMSPPMRRCGKR
jgi:hypothetical protein